MKRILIIGWFGMVVTMICAGQTPLQQGNATWYETSGVTLRAAHATLPFGTRIRVTNLNNNRQTIVTISGRIPNEMDRILDISQEAAKNLDMLNPAGGTTPVTIEVLGGGRVVETPVEIAVAEPPPEDPPPPPPPEDPPPPPPPPAPVPEPVVVQAAPPAELRNFTIQTIININGSTVEVSTKAVEGDPPAAVEPPPPPPPPAPRFPPAVVYPRMPDPGNGHVYRVQVGSYLSPLNAQNTFERLKANGFNPAYEKYEEYYRVVLSGVRAADMQYIAQELGNQGIREVWIRQEY